VEQVADRLWVTSLAGAGAALPLSYPPLSRALSARVAIAQIRWAARRLRFDAPLLWFYWWFFPEIVHAVPHRFAVYDIYDDHAEYDFVRTNPRRQNYTREIERALLDGVDLAFAVSQKLVRTKSGATPVFHLPNGVEPAVAQEAERGERPIELADLPRPVVGYLGSYDSRLDWELVEDMVEARPSWSFVFVGGGYTSPRREHANLHLLGNRDYPDALRYVKHFDVALIPFVRDALTDAVCPAKLFDYLALGKPIVTAPIPAIDEVVGGGPEAIRARNADEYVRGVESALIEDPSLSQRRRTLAASFTWERRTERALALIAEHCSCHAH
jgi:glycosyltransferase involved in cell wall biosynthesis